MRQPLLRILCQTSTSHRHAYQSVRSKASATVWTTYVVSNSHSMRPAWMGPPPYGPGRPRAAQSVGASIHQTSLGGERKGPHAKRNPIAGGESPHSVAILSARAWTWGAMLSPVGIVPHRVLFGPGSGSPPAKAGEARGQPVGQCKTRPVGARPFGTGQ